MDNYIYLIIGERGEYSDWETWVAAAHTTKEQEQNHLSRINELKSKLKETWSQPTVKLEEDASIYNKDLVDELKQSLDVYYPVKNWLVEDYKDYSGTYETLEDTKYSIICRNLSRHVDEYMEQDHPDTKN